MKILIINDLRKGGGAEVQTDREFRYFSEMGHDVYLLTFDGDYPLEKKGHRLNIPAPRGRLGKAFYRVARCPEEGEIRKAIEGVSPDVVHVNNVYNTSASLFRVLKRYPTVQTVRDYSIICPKAVCVDKKGIPCDGYSFFKCLRCAGLEIEGIVRTCILSAYNRSRVSAVNMLVAPSKALSEAAARKSFDVRELNNPFEFADAQKGRRGKAASKTFFSYGRISREKGFDALFEAWNGFAESRPGVELLIAGRVERSYERRFLGLLGEARSVRYLGELDYGEIMGLYPGIRCVVVPSVWMENYPNTVLEALANRTVAIGSARGGIPEMIGDGRFIFEPTNPESICAALVFVDGLSESEYRSITEENFRRVRENNSQERYYERLMSLYREAIASNDLED